MMSNGQKPTNFNDMSGMYEEVVDQKDCKFKAHFIYVLLLFYLQSEEETVNRTETFTKKSYSKAKGRTLKV